MATPFDDFDNLMTGMPPTAESESAGVIDLDSAVREYVGTAVRKYRLGGTFWYSVAATVLSLPTGPCPAYVVTMYMRAPVPIGTVLVEGAVQTGFPTQGEFDSIVSNLIENLRQQSSAALKRL